MISIEFQNQVNRLIKRFGPKAFDAEFNALLWKTVLDMNISWFEKLVDNFIGNFRQAPLLVDFREAAYKERQARFNSHTHEATAAWASGEFEGLKRNLDAMGAISLTNAVEQERWRIRNEPDDFEDGK